MTPMFSTTDPDLTRKPIPEDQRHLFIEELSVYCPSKTKYIVSQLWKCVCCEDNLVKSYGSKCSDCVKCFKRKRPFERSFNKAKCNAPREKIAAVIEWRMSYEEYVDLCLIPNCHYCGAFLNRAEHEGMDGKTTMLLDRKDSNEHYTRENCVPCCPDCNKTKGELMAWDEMHMLIAYRRYKKLKDEDEKSKPPKAG